MSERKKNYIVVPNLIQLVTNVDYFPHFTLGPELSAMSTTEDLPLKIHFFLEKRVEKPANLRRSIGPFLGGRDTVCYDFAVFKIIRLQAMLKDLLTTPCLTVNTDYYRLIHFAIGNLLSAGDLCGDIIWARLAMRHMSYLHSSCVSLNDHGVIVVGHPGTGKTLLAYLAGKKGAHVISEDITVVDERSAYSCPFTQSFLNEPEFVETLREDKKLTTSEYLKLSLLKNMRLPYSEPPKFFNISRIRFADRTVEQAHIGAICILERGAREVKEIDKDETLRRLLLYNRNEFHYYHDMFLSLYSLYNPDFKYLELLHEEGRTLAKLVEKCRCLSIKTNDPTEYANHLMNEIG